MKIQVKVKPNAKFEAVEKDANGIYTVRVNAPPVEGKANERVIRLLAEYFKVAPSRVTLLKGRQSKIKILEVSEV